ncbi:igiC [Pseudomonas amygdali pv. eriobotryae]|uniref:Arylmalonate decarboxylase n=1 Tax=Pseudomonas amygdali pv. eriobotryae TaxID=129137 RepID=A0A0P9QKR4_PSEA0|nr:arylmalonate decarboxylase [Pseudomonas amygdali]KPX31920.1 Arylmalonate decarboxylase [Pseudomonas amygdali pv. eriobotryae]KWS78359.1 arylmalonate decarboxylase [Pseudomonas amygdali pv. eriobotryae]RMO48403.1 Arylmalonate decarboxylase [Pseudomonas amygdali pv. eriobotryae]GFZ62806.1 igiC [Pseudomonas amygdali pv. eriobotryae]GFZ68152.1 igiC [Pseudomonas amygdali pv. eriobotryae]
MTDSLGFRLRMGIIAPSTNTSVQPEMDDMRPYGVTNHFGRLYIPNSPIEDDAGFDQLMRNIRASMDEAARVVMTCDPDRLVLGMSSETFWDGKEGSDRLKARMEEIAGGKPVTMGSDAVREALACYGNVKKLGIVTPYQPLGDEQVIRFFEDCGFEVVALKGLKCSTPVNIAHVSEKELRDAFNEVNDSSVEAIVQVGTNLAAARVADVAEFWLDKPVIAINTATYWHALRNSGVNDRVLGFGSLLRDF